VKAASKARSRTALSGSAVWVRACSMMSLTLPSAARPLMDVTAPAPERRDHSLSRGTMSTTGELTAAVALEQGGPP
jgi:hypothetical protein